MELSPNYSATLRGFTSTVANVMGFVSPLIAGSLTNNNVSFNTYMLIYVILALIHNAEFTI